MPTSASPKPLVDARASLRQPMSYDEFLNKLSPKDRLSAEKHVALCEEIDPAHAALWQRLARTLMTLAPLPAKLTGKQYAQFFVPDGKYRMQAFALEDLREGTISVYCSDVLDESIDAGLITASRDDDSEAELTLAKVNPSGDMLEMERLDGRTANPAEFYKHMLGWNRRALRMALRPDAPEPVIEAVEVMCALSLRQLTTGRSA